MKLNWTFIFRRRAWRKGTSAQRREIEIRYVLARRLRAKRRRARITQRELAQRIGSAQPTISKLERASLHVTMDLFVRAMIALDATDAEIAEAFNASTDGSVFILRRKGELPALLAVDRVRS
jgi:transcriptional regulator with XRE-family HTH domain